MITVWFFLALYNVHGGAAVTQAGPFRSQVECEKARAVYSGDYAFRDGSACYQGVMMR